VSHPCIKLLVVHLPFNSPCNFRSTETYGFGSLIAAIQGVSLTESPGGQQGQQESTMCPGSTEGQCHPGQCCQKVKGGDPSPLLSSWSARSSSRLPHTKQTAYWREFDEGSGASLLGGRAESQGCSA